MSVSLWLLPKAESECRLNVAHDKEAIVKHHFQIANNPSIPDVLVQMCFEYARSPVGPNNNQNDEFILSRLIPVDGHVCISSSEESKHDWWHTVLSRNRKCFTTNLHEEQDFRRFFVGDLDITHMIVDLRTPTQRKYFKDVICTCRRRGIHLIFVRQVNQIALPVSIRQSLHSVVVFMPTEVIQNDMDDLQNCTRTIGFVRQDDVNGFVQKWSPGFYQQCEPVCFTREHQI